ncbi:helix-turn-helix domain-containing protein [Horticoccus luteus]|uniref:Helix-turn-helix domain-containing protein n=1 Tax=Horticoccus luteus TaxID=2862869 RepID=A0A8F9TTQ3_9BACT|nr:helix-turn-helix domain-containing protein [Horticoccus luteus]QYM77922.1 helix-turn-helix domain-containing protein [Horticoccus luteus]
MHLATRLQRSLDLAETRLRDRVTLEELARAAGLSLWHFQRVFSAAVGKTVASYLRQRRLTSAAHELRHTSRRILDIALEYQFESHEAFTRAFKTAFSVTPSEFRRRTTFPWAATRPPLNAASLRQRLAQSPMTPQIVSLPAFTLIGFEARFISAMSPDATNLQVIPPLWRALLSRRHEITGVTDASSYGACRCLPPPARTRDDELLYLAGVSASSDTPAPAGMSRWSVPPLTYALFTHHGLISELVRTINFAWGTWLPASKFAPADGPELERYDERFRDGGADSALDYLLPIQPAS